MFQIENFKKEENVGASFTVVRDDERFDVTIEQQPDGVTYTDIDEFTENWTDSEYYRLESFIDGCSNLVYQFYHD